MKPPHRLETDLSHPRPAAGAPRARRSARLAAPLALLSFGGALTGAACGADSLPEPTSENEMGATVTTVSLNPTDDAFLENTTRYDSGYLKVETSAARTRTAYLKFVVAGVGTKVVTAAKLRLNVNGDAGSGTVRCHMGSHSNWTELTLSTANAPAKGDVLSSVAGTHALAETLDLDLTGDIAGDGSYTLVLDLEPGGNDVWFGSGESAAKPVLELELTEPDAAPPELSFAPTHDAFLENGIRYDNGYLKIETSAARTRTGYLQFDVSGIGAEPVTYAKLRLKVDGDAGTGTIRVHRGSHSSWTETTLTSANAPAKSELLGSSGGTLSLGKVVELDVTNEVTDNGTYTLVVDQLAGGNDVWFSSSEGSAEPDLVVGFGDPDSGGGGGGGGGPPVSGNVGESIGGHNTGHAALVIGDDGQPIHEPATLVTHNGNFSTTSNGQVIENLNITGVLFIKHDNVTVRNCKVRNIWEEGGIRKNPKVEWTTIGTDFGVEDPDTHNSTAIRLGDFLIYRSQIYGFIDLIHPEHGDMQLIESWLHSPYADPTSKHYGGNSAHTDPIQPRPSFPGWTSFLIQGNRFDTWPYKPGQKAGSTFGDLSPKPSTSGAFNFEFSKCKNTTFRDNYVDGNYSQGVYNFYGAKELGNGGPPTGTVIIDNRFKLRRTPCGGTVSFMNFGDSSAKVVYGNNIDADTETAIPNKPPSCGGGPGTVLQPGPSSQYPSFYP